jgi:anti-anti-sigma regulatory factor
VRWLDRHALVTLPERIEQSGAVAMGEQLQAIIDGDVLVLILDLTGTAACDHAGGDMLARVYHRAVARGTAQRLVAGGEKVLRVLTLTGIDRLVPVHASVGAALAATAPGESTAQTETSPQTETRGQAEPAGPPPADDVGVEVALLDRDGVIVSVNAAWQAFAVRNGGDPARTGPGASYLDACAAVPGDLAAAQVASAIRAALAGDLPGSLTIQVPCHSPSTERWFDVLISARRDDDGRSVGAAVTLSLTRSQTRVLLPTGQPAVPDEVSPPGPPGASGALAARDRDLIGEMTDRLSGLGRILEESAGQAAAPLAGQLRWAAGELDAIIQAARTSITPPRRAGECTGEEDA